MNDFTLVIPTYNRPQQLAALLRYLEGVPWNIIVLDSSYSRVEGHMQYANRTAYFYPSDTHPFDKMASGLQYVMTEYCGFCADDDLILPQAVPLCLETLRKNPWVSVVQGNAFSFLRKDGKFTLESILRLTDSVLDDAPLMRVAKLMGNYRALTYGIYRTETLRKVLTEANKMESMLGRELLAGALTTVEGAMVNLPCFSHGRDGAEPTTRHWKNWHPLEWIVKDADGLMHEYTLYRKLLRQALFDKTFGAGTSQDLNVIGERKVIDQCLDLIHLRYLSNYTKVPLLNFMIEHMARDGKMPLHDAWPSELRDLLADCEHNSGTTPILGSDALEDAQKSLRRYEAGWVDTTAPNVDTSVPF